MPLPDGSQALDHIVVVLFENRSLDNVLGHLYTPEDGKNIDGVIGMGLSNPIPVWAEHRDGRDVRDRDPPPRLIVDILRGIASRFFPLLAEYGKDTK